MSSLFSFDDDSLSFYPELCTLPDDIDVAQYDCTLLGVTVPCSPNYTDKDIALMGDQLELMHLFTFFVTVSIGLTCLRGTVDSDGNFIWQRSMAINSGFYAIFTGGFALFRWYFGVSRPLAVTGVLHNLFEWGIILHLTKIEKNEYITKVQILERRFLIVFCMQIILISLGIIIPSLKHGFAAVQVFGIVMDFAYPMLFIHKYFTLDDNDENKLEELKKFYYYPALAHSIHLFLTILPLAMSIFLSLSPSWFTLVVVELAIHVSVPITHLIYAVWAWDYFDEKAWPKRDGDFNLPEKLTLPLRDVRRVFISCFVLAIIFFGSAPKVLGPCASALIRDNCEYREEYTVSSIANVQPGFQLAFKEWVTSQKIEKQAKGLQGNIDFEVMYDYGNQSRYQMISNVGAQNAVLPHTEFSPKVEMVSNKYGDTRSVLDGYGNGKPPEEQCNVVHSDKAAITDALPHHQLSRNDDVLRRQAGSYLMAAKNLLSKVNRRDLTLLN